MSARVLLSSSKVCVRKVACCCTHESSNLPLAAVEWVTLRSGERVRVDTLGYRPNVAVVLFRDDGKVFTCRRISGGSKGMNWQFPQGGVDPGELPQEAALRELAEETCITSVELVAEHPEWLAYDFDVKTKERLGRRMEQWRGQKQKYFLMKWTGEESEINLCAPGHYQEFDKYEWVDLAITPTRVATFKRHVYEEVVREFGVKIEEYLNRV